MIDYNRFNRTEVTDYSNAASFYTDLYDATRSFMESKGLNLSSPYAGDFVYWRRGIELDLEIHGDYLTYGYLFDIIDTVKHYFDIWQTEKVPTCVMTIKQPYNSSSNELVVGCGSISVGNPENDVVSA